MHTIEQIYGTLVFTRKNMQELLSKEAYNKYLNVIHSDQKELVDLTLANEIANAMKE
jgi:glutamine synthetase type III